MNPIVTHAEYARIRRILATAVQRAAASTSPYFGGSGDPFAEQLADVRHEHSRMVAVARRRRIGEGPCGRSPRDAARKLQSARCYRLALAVLKGHMD